MTTPRGWRSSCALSAPTSPVTIPTCCSFASAKSRPRRSASLCRRRGIDQRLACCPSGHSPDVNRQQLSEVVAHWQAFYNAKESGVSQSVLVLGASGYIGQHLVRELSARGYPVLAAARHIDRLQNSLCPALPAGQSISISRRTCLRYSPVSIPFIIWSTAWAKAVILSPMSGGWRRMCAMPCVSHQCAGDISQFAAGPGAGAVRPSARSSDYRRSPA